MALFGNQNKKSIEELENYYSGKQQRSGMAWVMAFFSLVLTVAVLGGLFFGGRWLYRSVTDDDTAELASTTTTTSDNSSSSDTVTSDSGVISDEAASTSTPSDLSNNTDINDAADVNDSQNQQQASANEDTTDTPANQVSQDESAPNLTATVATAELPNTGASLRILVSAPLTALAIGYLLARRKFTRS